MGCRPAKSIGCSKLLNLLPGLFLQLSQPVRCILSPGELDQKISDQSRYRRIRLRRPDPCSVVHFIVYGDRYILHSYTVSQ
jgi:hypothetical protein